MVSLFKQLICNLMALFSEEARFDDGRHKKMDADEKPVPKIYACATMWHETEQEMKQLLKSIFRYRSDSSTC